VFCRDRGLAPFFGVFALAAFAAVFRCSDVCTPNFLVNRRRAFGVDELLPAREEGMNAEQISGAAQAWSSAS